MTNDKMNRTEFESRMRQELAISFWTLKSAQTEFSESDFQAMKSGLQADLENYAENYVNPAENE